MTSVIRGIKTTGHKSLLVGALLAGLTTTAVAGPNGKPFQEIQAQLDAMNSQIAALQASIDGAESNAPVTVDVNCDLGDSLHTALANNADSTAPLTVNITGLCVVNQVLSINRDNVTLNGVAAGAGLNVTLLDNFGLAIGNGAKNVTVQNLQLIGGTGFVTSENANSLFSNVDISSSEVGLVAVDGAFVQITDSLVHNNQQGLYAARNGVIEASNTVIENNNLGLLAFKRGLINLVSRRPDGTVGTGSTSRNNQTGGAARSGGHIELEDSRIEQNNIGLIADSLGTIQFFVTNNGTGNVVTNNTQIGIYLQRNSALVFSDSVNEISNQVYGIYCVNPTPSYITVGGTPGTLFGNAVDVLNCVP